MAPQIPQKFEFNLLYPRLLVKKRPLQAEKSMGISQLLTVTDSILLPAARNHAWHRVGV